MSEPAIAAAVAWIWLDQVLSWAQLAGGALVLVGVTLVQAQPRSQGFRPTSDAGTPDIEPVAPGRP